MTAVRMKAAMIARWNKNEKRNEDYDADRQPFFFLRCAPQAGDYDCYCYCYDRGLLEQAMTHGEDMSEEENIGMEMN